MNFFSFNFPLREYIFLYFASPAPPPPNKFSNAPSLNRGFTVIVYNRNNVVVADAVVGLIELRDGPLEKLWGGGGGGEFFEP